MLGQRLGRSVRGVLTVSTNTKVDLLVERISLEGFGDTKNGILKKKPQITLSGIASFQLC